MVRAERKFGPRFGDRDNFSSLGRLWIRTRRVSSGVQRSVVSRRHVAREGKGGKHVGVFGRGRVGGCFSGRQRGRGKDREQV